MYSITYKNKLRQGKNIGDFQTWLKAFWNVQKSWGAETVHIWMEEDGDHDFIFCEYRVPDIRRWNRLAQLYASSDPIRELGQIVETSRITVSRLAYSPEPLPSN